MAEITSVWPEIDDWLDEDVDECPWNASFDLSPAYVISPISWERADDVVPVYVETALRLGLFAYDPQEEELLRPA